MKIDLSDSMILKGTIVLLEMTKSLHEKQLLETPGSCRGLKKKEKLVMYFVNMRRPKVLVFPQCISSSFHL